MCFCFSLLCCQYISFLMFNILVATSNPFLVTCLNKLILFFITPMFYMLLPLIIFLLHLNFLDTIRDIPYTVVFFLIFQFAFPMKMCFFFLFVLVPWLIMRQRSLICMFSASLTFKFNLKYRDFMPIVDLVYINSSAL